MKTRRETELMFSKFDMLGWARYLADGKKTESDIQRIFQCWIDGPEAGQRIRWIKDK